MRKTKWVAVYIMAVLVAVIAVTAVEGYWRNNGYKPVLIDSKDLWSLQRDQLGSNGGRALAFIGASRTLYSIDLPYVRSHWPGYRPVMLAVNGHYPLNMLGTLARDERFTGTVIVDIDARGLSEYNHAMQDPYIDYYASIWSPARKGHRLLLNYWQEHMVIAGPEFGLTASLSRLMGYGALPQPVNSVIERDRNSALDFSLVDASALAKNFAQGLQADIDANPPAAPHKWIADLAKVADWVERIELRGGRVIFYTPPVTGSQYRLAEAAYPRHLYWDAVMARYGFNNLLAEDIPEMDGIELPDESHMDRKDKAKYTRILFEALRGKGYLQSSFRKGILTP